MSSKRLYAALALALLGAALSGVLLLQHHGEPTAVSAVAQACGEGDESGCDLVALSPYAKLAGIPLAALGVAFYLCLAVLLLLATQSPDAATAAGRVAFVLLGLALVFDLVLLGLQAFAIGAFCKLCLSTYALNAAALYALWPARRGALLSAVPTGRLLGFGWGLASLLALALALSWDAALAARAERRGAGLLGSATATAGGAAQAEIERLKGILEDPKKHEEYLQQKYAKEFESAKVETIALLDVPFKGAADARIKVVEYSDFLCPFCRAIAGAFRDFVPQAQGRVSVYFKNYPLDKECNPKLSRTIHPGACWLAKGAICAEQQHRFWEYHDKVFSEPPQNPVRNTVLGLGSAAGLDGPRLAGCLDAPATAARLRDEVAEAERLGVASTPSLFINGKKLARVNDFLAMIGKESARLGLPPLPSPAPTH